jgi:hypothetical protein
MGHREGGHGPHQHPQVFNNQQQPQNKQQVVHSKRDVLDAVDDVAAGYGHPEAAFAG